MPAPIGAEVGLYYDSDVVPEEDHYLQTPTKRSYYITEVRVQKKGQHAGRRCHLRAVVVSHDSIPADAVVHPIYWYKR